MADMTYCISKDCETKCYRHLSNYNFPAGTIISISDFSGICRAYIQEVLEEVEKKDD